MHHGVRSVLRSGVASPIPDHGVNMTSSTKPEVHNVSPRRQKKTEPENLVSSEDRFRKYGRDRQTDRHADRDTLLATGGGVITSRRASSVSWNSVHSVCVCVC